MKSILKSISELSEKTIEERVQAYNNITKAVHEMLGFAQEHPSLSPQLISKENIIANDYNPNKVAPPEMKLLSLSIEREGLTMPVVVNCSNNKAILVDGFHRVKVCSRGDISDSLKGYIPCSILNKPIETRMAATVRHNMARGSHQTKLTAELVMLLKKYNWSDEKIGIEIGMEPDEILRLKQTTGLAEAFADEEYSQAWFIEHQKK